MNWMIRYQIRAGQDRSADGGGDFRAEELAVTLAEAVNPAFEGALRDAELGGQHGVGDVGLADEVNLELVKVVQPAVTDKVLTKVVDDPVEDGTGPAALEDALRRLAVGGLAKIAVLGIVERKRKFPATAAERGGPIMFVGEKEPHGIHQKVAKTPFLWIGAPEKAAS